MTREEIEKIASDYLNDREKVRIIKIYGFYKKVFTFK